ncbi:tRNA uridine-5-carboxymethylaminomethyl(34) synthesis enzyme MnmG [candidate division KSB1 bacterium]
MTILQGIDFPKRFWTIFSPISVSENKTLNVSRETPVVMYTENYDIIVIGAGHAGCEAALASARMGSRTLLMTMNLSTVAKMPCNPAIGGLAKGHLVKETDALGGEMGKITDKTTVQFRMLNKSKGPAVWSPRAQVDREMYTLYMKSVLENTKNLYLKEAAAISIHVNGNKKIVTSNIGAQFGAPVVIVTGGTFLNGLVHIGLDHYPAGRAGEFPSKGLSESINELGIRSGRFKTGTPPRIDGKTVDFSKIEPQKGDEIIVPFSYSTEKLEIEQMDCFFTYTNEKTHDILRKGFGRSPLFTGVIEGTGPRYCPSIEVKLERFSDKDSHQIILEPEGRNTTEYYVNGFSTSLPLDIQIEGLRSIPGLEKVDITRPAYAIEYDFFYPDQLGFNLESKIVDGLFFAGQINGTSGYEEAAAQGIMAGINAVLKLNRKPSFELHRDEAYIGVLIDDLIVKGPYEPYRMFTSRAEYRLLLRQDNADVRLMKYGREFNLVPEEIYNKTLEKIKNTNDLIEFFKKTSVAPEKINPVLEKRGTSVVKEAQRLYRILKRPEIRIKDVIDIIDVNLNSIDESMLEIADMEIKYEGYIIREKEAAESFKKLENMRIPEWIDYDGIPSVSNEAKEKFKLIKPVSLGQAQRIPGINPTDITALLVQLKKGKINVSRETR